jgi:septum formation protein
MIILPKLVLASGSPRRAEILRSVGWEFTVEVPDVDETPIDGESPTDYTVRLAREKAIVVAEKRSERPILAADTTVVVDDEIVGKPDDLEDARRMLRMLSGRWHEVVTGVALMSDRGSMSSSFESTRVKFAKMNDAEIELLVEHGGPLDKAGAYAVQAQAALFIEAIEGAYWNVVGLPINLVYRLLDGKAGADKAAG